MTDTWDLHFRPESYPMYDRLIQAMIHLYRADPNRVYLRNLMNCPFSVQVGVRDYYSESALRCIRGAECDQVLNDYHDLMDCGYEHQVLVRVPAGHNFDDFTDIS